jgi:predicted phosphodiesterase
MTQWAFVSDIHGNRRGLERAISWCENTGVDAYACLGDVIGRGDPDACVAWVRDAATIAIVGNRDLDYLERLPGDLRDVVRSWPNEDAHGDFLASHGDPHLHRVLSSAAERDGFSRAVAYMVERGARAWFFGHTHRARVWRVDAAGAQLVGCERIVMDSSARYVVNVGTTGLPLPGRGGPSFAVYDDVGGTLEVIPLP